MFFLKKTAGVEDNTLLQTDQATVDVRYFELTMDQRFCSK